MPKALLFLLFLTVFSLASLWFVENDGSIIIEWMGYRVQTSVAFAVLFSIIIIVACTLFLQFLIWVKTAPGRYKRSRREKRLNKGLTELTQGFAAIAAGDKKRARSLTQRASNNLDNMPITKLLAAQTAQLEGNGELAKEHYNSMLGDKETEIIAIKGLLIEAKQDSDLGKALFLAEKAFKLQPEADWVILILFDLYRKMRKWEKAEQITRNALKYKLITSDEATRNLGIIEFARHKDQLRESRGFSSNDRFIKNAFKLIPDFIPVAVEYANILVKNNKTRKAVKILENIWSKSPHPDISVAYMNIYSSLSKNKRLEKAEKLIKLCSNHPEGYIVAAQEAIAAEKFDKARKNIKTALEFGETTAICNVMAELQSIEQAGQDTVNYWRERAIMAGESSVWKCKNCSELSNAWHVICASCHSFDSIEWKNPDIPANVPIREDRLLMAD